MAAGTINSDHFLLFDQLPEKQRDLAHRVRAFVTEDLLPIINEYWERAEFPLELLPGIRNLGVIGSTIDGYGCPGLSRVEAGLVAMEMSRGDGSVNTFLAVQSGLTMGAIALLGDEDQKQRWLPSLAALDTIGAFALTEPEHGSDSVALESTATLNGDHYILNGSKRWIGNGDIADVTVLWARDTSDGEVKGFVVEREPSGERPDGYTTDVIVGKVGKRAILQANIHLQDVRVPVENKLAHSHTFQDAGRVLANTRTGAAWEALGHATAVYELAVDYCLHREQFGQPIAHYQLVQNRLANMLAELTAMQLVCFRAAELADQDLLSNSKASLAKMHTAKKALWICREGRDLLGGNGLLLENHIVRHMTDMEVVSTYEGTDAIQSLIIGREITGTSAFRSRPRATAS